MERFGQGIAGKKHGHCIIAHLIAVVAAGIVLMSGCQACILPQRQIFPTAYSSHADQMPIAACADLAAAKSLESQGRGQCVDVYYQVATDSWRQLESGDMSAYATYQESLARMIPAAIRFGRLDPRGQLAVAGAPGGTVPIAYYGFAWKRADFCQLIPATDFNQSDFKHYYHASGIGVSLVAVRQAGCEEMFYPPRLAFPVTAVLRPSENGAVLEFYNPLMFDSIHVGPEMLHIDRDLTASLAYLKETIPRKYISGFFDPSEKDLKPKLGMIEPYQPGKIPVVFIHGLGSDPLTWADATNWFRSRSDIYRRYQFWYFRYPTGGDLLKSAAALREQLQLARETFDPQHCDPAMEQMVLVGHSMGGLVAQLQVTYSSGALWRRVARQPLEAVRTTPDVRAQLQRSFFFEPSPLVKRVVFIATPHRGSNTAERLIGRAASNLVYYPPEQQAAYRELMDNNRDIFSEYLQKRQPTTIDLLEPDNPLLEAMAQMPFKRCVRVHSIIGDRFTLTGGQDSDGVVPVSSARLTGVCSERFVLAKHESTNKVDDTMLELERILGEHAAMIGMRGGEAQIVSQ